VVEMNRRRFLAAAGLGVAGVGGSLAFQRYRAATNFGPAPAGTSELDWIADHLVDGGPPPDGIPPIEDPRYLSPSEAESRDWLEEDEVVDGWMADGQALAAPRSITVSHEIVWTEVGDRSAAVTYCPLTGSTIGFRGETADGAALRFGTSGKLYNNNLVMYDRQTNSLWPQMLGTAVEGPLKGRSLETFPVRTTTWGRWRDRHPDSQVLSRETGYSRSYDRDPYGDYYSRRGTPFPNAADVSEADVDLHPKAEVFPVERGEEVLCVEKGHLREEQALNVTLGGTPVALLHDAALDTLLAHRAEADGRRLRFRRVDGGYEDEETGSTWTAAGRCVEGELEGTSLDRVPTYEAFWFAWYAYNPDTRILV
jgi:hypothetical protein